MVRKNLVLTGFMGTGKSAVGRKAARRLRMQFVDMDELLEERAGMSVSRTTPRRRRPRAIRPLQGLVLTRLLQQRSATLLVRRLIAPLHNRQVLASLVQSRLVFAGQSSLGNTYYEADRKVDAFTHYV